MKSENISFQYVPPHSKRRNAAERAIRKFKNHFTVDKDFPLQSWDAVLPQTEMTLNLMRGSRVDPLHGKYNFDAHPIAPRGMRIVLHEEKPHQRGSWSLHGVEGFYLGPALEHYRCYRGWVVKTQRERVTDTVAWHSQTIMMPGASEKELLIKALADLQTAIHASAHNLPPPDTLSLTALHQELTKLFPPLPSSTIYPIQQILPQLYATTQRIHPGPRPANGDFYCYAYGTEGGTISHHA